MGTDLTGLVDCLLGLTRLESVFNYFCQFRKSGGLLVVTACKVGGGVAESRLRMRWTIEIHSLSEQSHNVFIIWAIKLLAHVMISRFWVGHYWGIRPATRSIKGGVALLANFI